VEKDKSKKLLTLLALCSADDRAAVDYVWQQTISTKGLGDWLDQADDYIWESTAAQELQQQLLSLGARPDSIITAYAANARAEQVAADAALLLNNSRVAAEANAWTTQQQPTNYREIDLLPREEHEQQQLILNQKIADYLYIYTLWADMETIRSQYQSLSNSDSYNDKISLIRRLGNMQRGKKVRLNVRLQASNYNIKSIALSGESIYVGYEHSDFHLFTIHDNGDTKVKPITAQLAHRETIRLMDVADSLLATAADDKWVKVWKNSGDKLLYTIKDHTAPITALQFHDRKLYTASLDGAIRIWKPSNGKLLDSIQTSNSIQSMYVGNNVIVAGHVDGSISVFDQKGNRPILSFKAHDKAIHYIRVEGDLLHTGSEDGNYSVWSSFSKKEKELSVLPNEPFQMEIQGDFLFMTWPTVKSLDIRDLRSGKLMQRLVYGDQPVGPFIIDGQKIVASFGSNIMLYWMHPNLTNYTRDEIVEAIGGAFVDRLEDLKIERLESDPHQTLRRAAGNQIKYIIDGKSYDAYVWSKKGRCMVCGDKIGWLEQKRSGRCKAHQNEEEGGSI